MPTTPQDPDTEDFLIAAMAYCLCWELRSTHAHKDWTLLQEWIREESGLSERTRWKLELYEEGPPSAQEERSILSRIEQYLLTPHDVVRYRNDILALLPEFLRETAASHSLMRGFVVPKGYSRIKSWLAGQRNASQRIAGIRQAPLSEREADFARFLEQPYFLQAFRSYWHASPKLRNNRQTRVLVTFAAALSQMVKVGEEQAAQVNWAKRLATICHFSEQTRGDLDQLVGSMLDHTYDAQELAYRFFIDAREVDKRNMSSFILNYEGELSDFTAEFNRGLLFGG
ncbi:hypothetical protein [Coraliomargarita parva]|uniref:hypothetical protein n=1 Tax=Coraliomargarita parva TaxID=3014050 RepID=UPI0022B452E4|nr:hypothetical protein [Coraliomargarita parva]